MFCCEGCKTVYQLLEDKELCDYYLLDERPGNKLEHFFSEKYRFLENEEIGDLLLDFKSETHNKITFDIPSIHCSSCIWLLENLSRFDEGITSSRIQFSKKKLTVDFHPQVTNLKNVVDLLFKLGYEPDISLEKREKPESVKSKTDFVKLGVSGFLFGNIMLLSFPEYLGLEIDTEYANLFAYLNLALGLPVMIYGASEFYLSALKGLKKGILNIDLPIAIGVLALFLRSSYEIVSGTGVGYFDSLAGLVFFLLIGRWFQSKTYEGLSFDRTYKSYFPLAVSKVNSGQEESALVEKLIPGDQILIRNMEIIPCDVQQLSSSSSIDYSLVTGESLPVKKNKNEIIYAGGRVINNPLKALVVKPVSKSYLTQLWDNPSFSNQSEEKSEKLIDKVSRYFTPVILLLAVFGGVSWFFIDPSRSLFVFTSVLIIACPCALALATPFTLGSLNGWLGNHGLYLKNSETIEKIWAIKHIIFDKTGTITDKSKSKVSFIGEPISTDILEKVKSLSKLSTHPLSQAVHHSIELPDEKISIKNYSEISGQGIQGDFQGQNLKLGSASFLKQNNTGISDSQVHLSWDGSYLGYFKVENEYRTGLDDTIENLQKDYLLSILSGDNEGEKENLKEIFSAETEMLFNQSPENKLEYAKSRKSTLMLGDGLNDAGALTVSDVGISVAENFSSFTPSSDAIITGEKVPEFHKFLALMRQAKTVIIIGIGLSFLYNLLGISFALTGHITPLLAAILMPISSITVVAFSTLSVQFLASGIKNKNS